MKNTDLSFLKECTAPVAIKKCELSEIAFIEYATKPLGNIKISALTRKDFEDRPEILEKYFKNENVKLDRFHIPVLSAQQYKALVSTVKGLKESNANLETASDYYIRKVRLMAVAKDLNCSVKQLDTTDYIWDERYYIRYNLIDNMRVVDDWYRDNSEDTRYTATANDVYIKDDPRIGVFDEELFNNLYGFCITAIRQRKVMLLGKIDKCLGALRNVVEYTNGFVENPTKQMIATLKGYKTYFETMLESEEMREFIKHNDDISIYGDDELTHSDYINTYRTVIKSLVSGSDEDISTFSDILEGVKDPYIDEIYEVLPEVKFKPWEYENTTEDIDD